MAQKRTKIVATNPVPHPASPDPLVGFGPLGAALRQEWEESCEINQSINQWFNEYCSIRWWIK